jgi:hypothetical protein
MKIFLDVTGVKNHGDINAVSDYLEEQGFNCPYSQELDAFSPDDDSTDHGCNTRKYFYARALKKEVPLDKTRRVTCHAAIGHVDWNKYEATLIVLADCEPDDYIALERVIAEYRHDITHNPGDPNAEYAPTKFTQDILAEFAKLQAAKNVQQTLAEPEKCPFCELKQEISFGSEECHMQLDDDGDVNVYREGFFQGAFKLPKCPQCGKDMPKK